MEDLLTDGSEGYDYIDQPVSADPVIDLSDGSENYGIDEVLDDGSGTVTSSSDLVNIQNLSTVGASEVAAGSDPAAVEGGEQQEYSLDDIYTMLTEWKGEAQELHNDLVVLGKNNDLANGLGIGILAAFAGGFVAYCFLGRIR